MRTNAYLWLKSGQRTRARLNMAATGSDVVARNRGPGQKFSTADKFLLLDLVDRRKGVLENKRTDGVTLLKNSRCATFRAAAIFNWHVGRQLAEFPELTSGGHLISNCCWCRGCRANFQLTAL